MNDFFKSRKLFLKEFQDKIKKPKIEYTKINIDSQDLITCSKCKNSIEKDIFYNNLSVCPKCNNHFRINARTRIEYVCDNNSFHELFDSLEINDPLHFPGYLNKLKTYQENTNEKEAFICGSAFIKKINVAIGVLDSYFMMGSMGKTVGKKVTNLIEYAKINKLPLIIFSASGGARMQEGIFSLMQMAKTSGALKYFSDEGNLYISVLTNPTTGGVAASFAFLGDIHIAETEALIGFAGQKVIKQTIGEDLPNNFQTSEFQLEKGFVDMVLNRKDIRDTIHNLLKIHNYLEVSLDD